MTAGESPRRPQSRSGKGPAGNPAYQRPGQVVGLPQGGRVLRNVPDPPHCGHAEQTLLAPRPLASLWASSCPPSARWDPRTRGRKAGFPADALASLSLRQADPRQEAGGGREGFPQLLGDFEWWLQVENAKLVRVIAMRTGTAEAARAREAKLQVRAGKGLFPRGCTVDGLQQNSH